MQEYKYRLKKLYCTLPEEIFNEIHRRRLFIDIDEIVTNLLVEYFRKLDDEVEQ